jgi:GDP-L-fucose synthase
MRNKRVLVTGGAGFLGRNVVAKLQDRGYTKLVIPRRSQYDLTRTEAIEGLFRGFRPEIVIHMAAVVAGIGGNRVHPGKFFYENAMMGIQLIDAARRFDVEKTVVLGSICAYPKFTPLPFREGDLWNGYPEETNAPYGIAKKALLVQCQAYREEYGMNAIFLLPVNLYGPGDNFDLETSHVIPAMIRKFVEAKREGRRLVTLWGDGSVTREFLHVSDAATGIVLATEQYDKPAPVNLGSGQEITIRDLARKIATTVGYDGEILWDSTKPNGQPRRCLDTSLADREFGFRALVGLDEGLRETIGWYLSQ